MLVWEIWVHSSSWYFFWFRTWYQLNGIRQSCPNARKERTIIIIIIIIIIIAETTEVAKHSEAWNLCEWVLYLKTYFVPNRKQNPSVFFSEIKNSQHDVPQEVEIT
jgi:uncharacterized membrane protein YbaN (DUF454 family)